MNTEDRIRRALTNGPRPSPEVVWLVGRACVDNDPPLKFDPDEVQRAIWRMIDRRELVWNVSLLGLPQ